MGGKKTNEVVTFLSRQLRLGLSRRGVKPRITRVADSVTGSNALRRTADASRTDHLNVISQFEYFGQTDQSSLENLPEVVSGNSPAQSENAFGKPQFHVTGSSGRKDAELRDALEPRRRSAHLRS